MKRSGHSRRDDVCAAADDDHMSQPGQAKNGFGSLPDD